MASLMRIVTVGRNTLLEAIRQQLLTVILLVALAMVSASAFFGGYVAAEQIKFIKDFSTGIMSNFGLVITILSTSMLLPQELQNRTIYTILAKPVRREEFLLGKFFGVVLLISFAMALMTLVFALSLYAQEMRSLADLDAQYDRSDTQVGDWRRVPDIVGAYNKDRSDIVVQAQDPMLIGAVALIYARLLVVAAIALFFSTFASSFLFTAVVTGMIYVIGCLESVARSVWLSSSGHSEIGAYFLGVVSLVIPDFNAYTIIDDILAGTVVPVGHIESILAYSVVYVIVLLWASAVIFRYREI